MARARSGLLGTLSAIAVGVSLGAGSLPSAAATSTEETPATVDAAASDVARLCQVILDTRTLDEFNALDFATKALRETADPCHEVADAQFRLLTEGKGPGAIAATPGYNLQ